MNQSLSDGAKVEICGWPHHWVLLGRRGGIGYRDRARSGLVPPFSVVQGARTPEEYIAWMLGREPEWNGKRWLAYREAL